MKILYILPGYGIAGGVRIAFEHCNRLAQRGHEVYATAMSGEQVVPWFPLKVPTIHNREAMETPWDVAVATSAETWYWARQLEATRALGFCQMRESLFYKPELRETIDGFYKHLQPFTIATWLAKWLSQWHEHVPIIPNGVNFEMFFPEPFESEFVHTNRPIILIEGHEYNPAKNTTLAHEVVARLKDAGYDILKWGFSQSPEEAERDWNAFWLAPDQRIIRAIYSSAGASGGLLLKTTRYEGRNCTVVEAMACKCPVVVTQCKGMEDLHHDHNCLVANFGNVSALTEHCRTLLDDHATRDRLVAQGYEYVHANLAWDTIIPKLERILEGDYVRET